MKSNRTETDGAVGGMDWAAWWRSAGTGDTLALAGGLLALALCMVLPLVAKAAPGAEQMESYGRNVAFFGTLWVLTAAVTSGAVHSKWMRRKVEGGRFPVASACVAAGVWLAGLAWAAGLLRM